MKPLRLASVVVQEIGGETLLSDPEKNAIHVLNGTAGLIWELCDGQHSLADIEQSLRARYTIPAEHDLPGDIRRTLATFQAKGLLQAVEPA